MRTDVATKAETAELILRAIDMMLTKVGLQRAPYRLLLEIPWDAIMKPDPKVSKSIIFKVDIEATWDEATDE